MKIRLLPFNFVRAFGDLKTGEIFVNVDSPNIKKDIAHEISHILSKDKDHGEEWKSTAERLGVDLVYDDRLKQYRKRLGIPDNIVGNIGNISGVQNLLTDYHLLQSYRKFSQRILGNEGHWEFKVQRGEVDGNYGGTIKLFPVPKGSFPVVVEYLPSVNEFRSPQARETTYRAFLAQMKIALGYARRKLQNLPGPEGGTIQLDGGDLVTEGRDEYDKIVEFALSVGEPLSVYVY